MKPGYQIVHAEERGDRCYENKKGWYYHQLDAAGGIAAASVTGPFDTSAEATIACDAAQRAKS